MPTPLPPWFSTDEAAGLPDFWRIYQQHYEAIGASALASVLEDPLLGPLVKAMTPEQRAAQQRDGLRRLARFMEGECGEYEAHLRAQAVVYARMGIPFQTWYRLVRTAARDLTPLLVAAYAGEPSRLAGALLGTQAFFDWAMSTLGEVYLAEKEATQKQLEGLRLRSVQLEAENRRIQEANRLKSEFLANMSHELRTPLNAIIGFAELLHDGQVPAGSPQFEEFLGDILASGRHLLQLINDVLDLAKVEAGRVEFHPEAVELRKLVGEVVAILRTPAAQKRIHVEVDVADELTQVFLDAARLKQVLYNYVSNALKFTGEEGRITIRARPEGPASFRLEVEDTGIGIAAEDLGRLFSEFQQLDAGAAKRHGGTGLGLALTRRLAEAQGGSVGVTSVPGRGSTFCAILPRTAARVEPAPAPRRLAGAPGAPSILVIEDNPRDQALIVRTLSGAGYAVETAATGAQATARCAERAFDAITLDLLLPDANGLEVLRGIRAGALNRDVPVIVITVVTEHGVAAGVAVHDVLAKPVEEGAILGSLERAGVRAERAGHVLVVDDDQGSAKLMAATLARLGYRSVPVLRAAEGLRRCAEAPPMAVILDLMMPEVDGFEFLERFRQLPRCASVPVIVWTVKDLTAEDTRRLQSSVQGVLQKGQDAGTAVLAALRSVLPPAAGA